MRCGDGLQPEENAGVNAELGFDRGHGRLVSNGGGQGRGGGGWGVASCQLGLQLN